MGGAGWRVVSLALLLLCARGSAAARSYVPPSPYEVLATRQLSTPVIDAVRVCLPDEMSDAYDGMSDLVRDGRWERVLEVLEPYLARAREPGPEAEVLTASLVARAATDRSSRLSALRRLEAALARGGAVGSTACGRLEAARLNLLLGRHPESFAELRRAEREIAGRPQWVSMLEAVAFYRAEGHYQSHHPFEAHLGFRELAASRDALIAAAARLRLTDLSFDAGKSESVKLEYEVLLPRAQAFGASIARWALRAAEASLDAGDFEAAGAWIDRYLEDEQDRERSDVAMIRLADVQLLRGDSEQARATLAALASRRKSDPPGMLAAVRAIDLRLDASPLPRRLATLLKASRSRQRGIRLYALGVLTHELTQSGDVDAGLAVATRLAYEGREPALTPRFRADLDVLLEQSLLRAGSEEECLVVVRRLGGRYAILMDRAGGAGPFLGLGGCLERLQMPWMATKVYRRLTRTFGASAARLVALPLARSAMASGDAPMVRAAATASLRERAKHRDEWRLLLAEAEFVDGRSAAAADLLREQLAAPAKAAPDAGRLHAVSLFARAVRKLPPSGDDRAILARELEAVPQALRRERALVFGEASLVAAELHRRAGDEARALGLYELAASALPDGPMRAQSLYRLGCMAPGRSPGAEGRRGHWERASRVPEGGPWRMLARFEMNYDALRQTYSGNAESTETARP